jgi:hypothetical protein
MGYRTPDISTERPKLELTVYCESTGRHRWQSEAVSRRKKITGLGSTKKECLWSLFKKLEKLYGENTNVT